ncbi:MAG: putative Rossmann-fold nucleotide-binding protein [Halieaceae bacterium]|jgi:predicted Rossmann-fold nucleotide-binding protein
MKSLCVTGGSSPGFSPEYMNTARSRGCVLVERDIELVNGGEEVGLMGEVASTVLQLIGAAYSLVIHC